MREFDGIPAPAAVGYRPDDGVATAAYLAMTMQRPLLRIEPVTSVAGGRSPPWRPASAG